MRLFRRIAKEPSNDRPSRQNSLTILFMLGLLTLTTSAFYAPHAGNVLADEVVVTGKQESEKKGKDFDATDSITVKKAEEPNGETKEPIPRALKPAPSEVPWPTEKYKSYIDIPPSGSGLRVQLDSRRWVELNSLSATEKIDGENVDIFWKADGELIDPPQGFDPLSLVPARVENQMLKSTRGVSLQVVGPKGTRASMSTSGVGGYGNFSVPIDDEFVQLPLTTIMSDIPYNHAYVEVSVSQENWVDVSLDNSQGMQVLQSQEDRRLYVVIDDAWHYAWQLEIERDKGEPIVMTPTVVGGSVSSSFFPESLRSSVRKEFQSAQIVGFYFDKDQPVPKLIKLQRSLYDVVRFENLSVFPGPKSAVRVTVNGVPISEEQKPTLSSLDETSNDSTPLADNLKPNDETDLIPLSGTIVDAKGNPVPDCWVGMFVTPQEFDQSRKSSKPFATGPPLAFEARTDDAGVFSILALKSHFVFDGSFWAVRKDGATGTLSMN
ncbi:MAG TPA: hypothetical protein DIW81_22925 [Planctomycetaceae bacterium]|nr:hypothetical protein [Planctomycetaceae bacterium]